MSRPKILFSGEMEHLCYTAYSNGEVTITKWTGHAARVVIPGEIRGMAVTKIGNGAFLGNEELKKIVLPESLKRIGASAFFFCSLLSDVDIPKNVSYIGTKAFKCTPWWYKLEQPFVIVGDGFLLRCNDMHKHIQIPDGVKTVGNAFFECPNMEEVTLPDSVIKLAPEAFSMSTKLKRFNAGRYLRVIGAGAFNCCTKLQEVNLPDNLLYVGCAAFKHCASLQTITLSGPYLQLGADLFHMCESLRSVQLSGNIRHLPDRIFEYCSALELCKIPDTVKTIGEYAFDFCGNLHSISLPKSLKRIENNAFSCCKALEELTIPAGVEHIGLFALEGTPWFEKHTEPFVIVGNGVLIACNKDFEELCIPQGVRAVNCYYCGEKLKSVVIPEGVVEIGESAFWECYTSIQPVLPQSLREIGESAFGNIKECHNLPIGICKLGSGAFGGYSIKISPLPFILEDYSYNQRGLLLLCGKLRRDIYTDLKVRLKATMQELTLKRWINYCTYARQWEIPNVVSTRRLLLDGEDFDWSDEDDCLLLSEILQFRERNKLFTLMIVDYKNEDFRRWEIAYTEKYGYVNRYVADGRGYPK